MSIQVVSYRCTLTNRMGRLISSTVTQNVLLHPDADVQLKGLSEGMRDIKKGERRKIFLRADEAYGFYDPKLVTTRPLEGAEFETPLKMNEEVQLLREGKSTTMRVIAISSDTVTLDGNHPLAGQDLIFDVQAIEARDATADEIEESVIVRSLNH